MADPNDRDSLRERLREREIELIVAALRESGWNQTQAARRLRLPRRTLLYRMKVLGIAKLGYGAPATSRSSGSP
jgi:two-component system, NtrC family, response regulator AtoC